MIAHWESADGSAADKLSHGLKQTRDCVCGRPWETASLRGERADTECREVNSCDILFQRRHSPKWPSQPSARCFPKICVFVVTSMHMDSDFLLVILRQKAFRKSDDLGKRWTKPVFPLCSHHIFDFYFWGSGHSLVRFRLQNYLLGLDNQTIC